MPTTLKIFGDQYNDINDLNANDTTHTNRTYVRPMDALEITANGTYDVTQYETVFVDVPRANTGTLVIEENGRYIPANEMDGFDKVICNVPTQNLQNINVNSNGTYYPAKDMGYDGIGDVSVFVTCGPMIGLDDDGDEVIPVLDPTTDVISITKVPTYISIISDPTKTTYNDGDTIDFSGIQVQLVKKTLEIYTDSRYTNGIVPFSELSFPITTATSGTTEIPVNWVSVYDGRTFTDTFEITVND